MRPFSFPAFAFLTLYSFAGVAQAGVRRDAQRKLRRSSRVLVSAALNAANAPTSTNGTANRLSM